MEALQRLHNRGSISTGYDIDNSCKFESDNTEYLNRTPGANGSRTTWTTSVWVKRTEIGVDQAVFSSVSSAQTTNFCRFLSSDKIRFYFQPNDVAATYYADTNAVFRDTSAWYHIVWGLDSTNSDGSKRFVVYVNGVYQESTWAGSATASTNCPQNSGSRFLQSEPIYIGNATYTNGHYFNGYMAELHVLDGIAPDPTDFGEYDEDSGIWKPKAYTGSHGTQGFYLDFADAADLGDDESGNGNDFTENNITSADQATDTPTNNFCTMNMLDRTNGNSKNQEGATKVTTDGGSGWCSMVATMGVTKGKWYWETQRSGGSSDSNDVVTGIVGSEDAYIPYSSAAQYYIGNVATSSSMGFYTTGVPNVRNGDGGSLSNSAGDIIMIGLDMDNSKIYFGVNGTWDALGTGGSSLHADFDGEFVLPAVAVYQGKQIKINFGGYASYTISSAASDADGYGTFEYAPPSGYYALCTKNLEEYG